MSSLNANQVHRIMAETVIENNRCATTFVERLMKLEGWVETHIGFFTNDAYSYYFDVNSGGIAVMEDDATLDYAPGCEKWLTNEENIDNLTKQLDVLDTYIDENKRCDLPF